MPDFDRPISQFIHDLGQRFPDAAFLALGQTALWDECVKATLLYEARLANPDTVWHAGVHDTDYFAKTIAHITTDEMFVAVGHDDGMTKDLWSAAGEISALFGSESVPTRAMYRAHGVPFDWLRDIDPAGRREFIAQHTLAWGWLGLVQTQAYNLIAHDVSLREIKKPLLDQFDWAVKQSMALVGKSGDGAQIEENSLVVRQWIVEYLENCQESCRLPDMYEDLLPRIYTLLCSDLALPSTTKTSRLLKFNRSSCYLPRFDLVGHFLNPKTREAASESYNQAVAGSAVYDLEHFGEGAIPFDLVIPGVGRGTIRILKSAVVIDTDPEETRIPITDPITRNCELAYVLEKALGPDVVLVGKAITLVDMIAAEYLVVFHETASGYTPTTRAFNDRLRVCGINVHLHPLVRLKYSTWDSLQGVDPSIEFTLPDHLATAFGKSRLPADEFGATWKSVVKRQEDILNELTMVSSPKRLMEFLDTHQGGEWSDLRREYEEILLQLRTFREKTSSIMSAEFDHKAKRQELTAKRLELEKAMGSHWRNTVQPLQWAPDARQYLEALEVRNRLYHAPLKLIEREAALARLEARRLRKERRACERSPQIVGARARLKEIVEKAERARLETVKTAFLTVDGLTHTDYRPTAWWFSLVDPKGTWIDTVRKTAVARWEDLVTPVA